MQKFTETQAPLSDLIAQRSSPLAFSEQAVEGDKLRSVLEAARWAPSSRNEQPWAYVVATHEDMKQYDALLGVLAGPNRVWAQKAPVLLLTMAHIRLEKDAQPNRFGFYDLGQANANLAMQATALGLATHQMGGFDVEEARERFAVPQGWEPVSVIALGYPGKAESLPESLRERQMTPRRRKPLEDFVFSETWGRPASIAGPIRDK